jgi:cytochrome P450
MYSSANGIFPRVAKEDNFLKVDNNTILIKKGTIVNTQTFSIHYKSTVYEEPNRFKPERFIDGEGKIISPEPYTWMNFSAGFRSCVGKQLALT